MTKDQFASLDSWYPGRYQYTETRDYADYVYEAEKLATPSGKKPTANGIISTGLRFSTKTAGIMSV